MKFLALFTFFAVAAAHRLAFAPDLNTHWENFKKIYGKSYIGKEEGTRRLIWESNVNQILHHNLAADMGFHSFKTGINEYSDLTQEEFFGRMTGFVYNAHNRNNKSAWITPSNVELPERVDWREKGFVTPVKNQNGCRACWAFASTGALEGQHKKKTGNLVSLSEQNLIDCSIAEGNKGCNGGGTMDSSFNYIKKNQGIDTEKSYPYIAKDGVCHFSIENVGATCTGAGLVHFFSESALMQAVATVGPIAAVIDSNHVEFRNYKSGIFDLPSCSRFKLDHAILVVGYGTEDGKDYWLVKNSWGKSWGMNGYVKMVRNKINQCGIATIAIYPLV